VQHRVAQLVWPVRAHGLRDHDVGQQQPDVDALGAARREPPRHYRSGRQVQRDSQLDGHDRVDVVVVGEHVQPRAVHHHDLPGAGRGHDAERAVWLGGGADASRGRIAGPQIHDLVDDPPEGVLAG
jgi:hypothetical protein